MDLLFHLWERRRTLSIEGNVSAYLFRSFRNRTIRHLRKSLPEMLDIDQLEERAEPVGDNADYNLICKEAENDYKYKLSRLSPQRQRVFELSREENLSYAEIARQMNLSVNTVENYMVAALAGLREQYKDAPAILILIGLSILTSHY
jgi:RNA polymerase sigma-70 factor (ECF subfamily)